MGDRRTQINLRALQTRISRDIVEIVVVAQGFVYPYDARREQWVCRCSTQ